MRSLVLLFSLWTLSLASCPPRFQFDDLFGKCLQYNSQPASFFIAEQNCASYGGHLVSIRNAFQNNQLLYTAQSSGGFRYYNYWIGLTLQTNSQWGWTDGTPLSYTNWEARQPQSYPQCAMALNGAGGTWTTSECANSLPYICAYSGDTTTTRPTPRTTATTEASTWYPYPYCGDGWYFYDVTRTCYLAVQGNFTFTQAENYCTSQSAHVSSITNFLENQLIYNMTLQNDEVWIGLTRTIPHVNAWKWTDGTPFVFNSTSSYSNWNSGEPNDSGKIEDCVEMYVQLNQDKGWTQKWNDCDCNKAFTAFVCKKPVIWI